MADVAGGCNVGGRKDGGVGRVGIALQQEAEVFFPAFQAVCLSCEIANQIFHHSCLNTWVIPGLAQQNEDTAYAVDDGRSWATLW